MPLPQTDAHAIAAFKRFYALLPRNDDKVLVILKLHLLVEEQVRAFLDERIHDKSALEKASLDCHQAICLAEAMSTQDIHPNVWEAARKLNRLRNEVAHNLEPSGVLDRMSHICTLIGLSPNTLAATQLDSKLTPLDDFCFAVSLLYNELSLYVTRKAAGVLRLVQDESAS